MILDLSKPFTNNPPSLSPSVPFWPVDKLFPYLPHRPRSMSNLRGRVYMYTYHGNYGRGFTRWYQNLTSAVPRTTPYLIIEREHICVVSSMTNVIFCHWVPGPENPVVTDIKMDLTPLAHRTRPNHHTSRPAGRCQSSLDLPAPVIALCNCRCRSAQT